MTWKRLPIAALFTLACAGLTVAAPSLRGPDGSRRNAPDVAVTQTDGHRSAGEFDANAEAARRSAMVDWLMDSMVLEALDAPVAIGLSKSQRASLANVDPAQLPYRVGVVQPLGELVDLSTVSLDPKSGIQRLPLGALRAEADGGFTWTLLLTSDGASALRVHFTELSLPPQARLFVYDLLGVAYAGPFVKAGPHGDGELWSPNVYGEAAVVQLRVDGPLTAEVLSSLRFVISDAGHSGNNFRLAVAQSPAKAHCSGNRECVENAECPTAQAWGPIADVQDGMAHYQFVSGRFLYLCSGGLLADTDDSSQRAYFLTANHCINKSRQARTMDTFFRFTVACDTSNCPGPGSPSTSGATILSTGSESDYTFMELNEAPPAGSFFLGWRTDAVSGTDGFDLHRVSHPSGEPQAYSTHDVDTGAGTCRSWPRGPWIYSRDTHGATEGGSSGSPVTDASGAVVGQLSGGCGTNVNDECDSVNNATVDGAFSNYYPQIEQWLDPTPCSPSPEVCDDGADNDCDGDTDCADSDCSAAANCADPGCGSGGNGSACDSDLDCSSCNCKRGTCRGN